MYTLPYWYIRRVNGCQFVWNYDYITAISDKSRFSSLAARGAITSTPSLTALKYLGVLINISGEKKWYKNYVYAQMSNMITNSKWYSIIENLLHVAVPQTPFDMIVVRYRPRRFIGHLYLILRYIFSRTAKSTQCPIRATHTCEIVCIYIGIRCRRRAYLNRKIGMILYYISY